MIEVLNISKSFTDSRKIVDAIKDVTLKIDKGEIFGIIGLSGAGKSTLVRCINLLERPSKGKVIVDKKDLMKLGERELRGIRKKIGMIFQHFNLMKSRNVYENIAYPLKGNGISKEDINKKVSSLLKLVNLEDKIFAYPSQLSGGQKQRVAIARALANDPKVLLCDEATSALDPETTHSILDLLKKVNEKFGITIVIITHEMSVIKEICSKVAVMEKGVVVESGDTFEVFSSPKNKITKKFIDSTWNLSKLYSSNFTIKDDERLLKLKYMKESDSESLISIISRKYNVNVNIIFGNIEIIQELLLGGLVVTISGKDEDIDSAIEYISKSNIEVEVIKGGRAS